MAVILGVLVAASYGVGDFFGGLASRRSPLASVAVLSHALGLVLLIALTAALRWGEPLPRDIALGAAGGAAAGVGLVFLYRGLSTGRMSVVAPITAVSAAVIPLVWGIGRGERPGAVALTGVAIALAAVGLISRSPDPASAAGSDGLRIILIALAAGLGFGFGFIAFGEASDGSGFWPVLAARATSVTGLTAGAMLLGKSIRARRPDRGLIVGAGLFDVTANALFLIAVRQGLLSLVAVLASLYPAGTVALARIVLKERITASQGLGLVFALAGVVLIAAG